MLFTCSSNCGIDDGSQRICYRESEVDVEKYKAADSKFQTGFLAQYKVLTKRMFFHSKDRILSTLNFGQILCIALFCGILWFQTYRSEATAKDRLALVSALLWRACCLDWRA